MSDVLEGLLADLRTEGDELWTTVSGLDDAGWATPTPSAGWTVATQVAHLLWTDEVAVAAARSLTGAEGKQAWDAVVLQAMEDPTGFVDTEAHAVARLDPRALLARWGAARESLTTALREVPGGEKLPWFGPPMSPTSMATARYMETWAHALDVREALGVAYEPSDRIRHVAHLAVRTRDFAFTVHERTPPAEPFRIELTAPSGETWTYGPDDAEQRVTGSALDLCLLATQRVHRDDTDLVAQGPDAEAWLGIAQCFAGPPGDGRPAR